MPCVRVEASRKCRQYCPIVPRVSVAVDMTRSPRNGRGFLQFSAPLTVLFWILIFNVHCCALLKTPAPSGDDFLAVFLSNARAERKSEKGTSKAASYYRKIIDLEQGGEEEEPAAVGGRATPEEGNPLGYKYYVSESLFELSEILEGSYRNVSAMSEGFQLLVRAAGAGHVRAQHRLAVAYATGLYGASLVPMDAGEALLLEYMSALGGSAEASMGMGYRYLYGIGVPESCESARTFYEYAANVAADQIRRRGLPIHSERVKISDVEVTSSSGRRDVDAEVVDYYKHMVSVGGDTSAAHTLGGMYLQGSRFIEQDLEKAMHYLQVAADVGNVPASGQLGYLMAQQLTLKMANYNMKYPAKTVLPDQVDEENLLRGGARTLEEEAGQNEEALQLNREVKAMMKLLKYAANRDDAHGLVGIGYVHFTGLIDIPLRNGSALEGERKEARNISMSYNAFFKVQGRHSDAGFYMGEILMGRGQVIQPAATALIVQHRARGPVAMPAPGLDGEAQQEGLDVRGVEVKGELPTIVKIDPVAAVRAYASSSQRGNLLALHRLSHLAAAGVGMTRSCQTAVTGFKAVAERGDWAHELTRAHRLFDAGDRSAALVLFSGLAAVGLESAQFNTAYLLMKAADLPWLPLSPSSVTVDAPHIDRTERAGSEHGEGNLVEEAIAAPILEVSGLQKEQQGWGLKEFPKRRISPVAVSMLSDGANNDTALFQSLGTKANCEARALALYAVSASQSSAESFLRVGDCFYYGCGGLSRDKVEAAMYYQLAADLRSIHAIFNLGLMHEAGDGVQQDFHLAKRFYDQAAEADADAKLPRAVALFLLSSHRSLQDYLGVHATEQLGVAILKAIRTAEDYYHRGVQGLVELLSSGLAPRARAVRDFQGDAPRRVGDGVRSFLESVQGSVRRAIASSEADEFEGSLDDMALVGLAVAFVCVLMWKRSRRGQQLRHQHLD